VADQGADTTVRAVQQDRQIGQAVTDCVEHGRLQSHRIPEVADCVQHPADRSLASTGE
jgi:hypothetical protein